MKTYTVLGILVIILGLLLSACTGKTNFVQPASASSTSNDCATPASGASDTCKIVTPGNPSFVVSQPKIDSSNLARTDSQGAVTFEVTPVNLNDPGNTLVFDVSMNTHMVDLSMNMAALASLSSDNGLAIQATRWDGPKGGHHVLGKLNFSMSADGISLLKTARELTLTIVNVDAPARKFTWQLVK